VTGAGLPTDLANSSVLASGMDYVVQPGDTLHSIAKSMNPVDPSLARNALVHQIDSSVVVPGEHIVIP
jgi:LysM repeat protein